MQLPLRLLRLANPVVRAVLDSRAHRLLSGSLMVLEYRSLHSGRAFRIPLLYAHDGDTIVSLALRPDSKQWWRTFRAPTPAGLVVGGRARDVDGLVLSGQEAATALSLYLARFPRAAPALGVRPGALPADLVTAAADVAVVVFRARPRVGR